MKRNEFSKELLPQFLYQAFLDTIISVKWILCQVVAYAALASGDSVGVAQVVETQSPFVKGFSKLCSKMAVHNALQIYPPLIIFSFCII